MTATPLYSNQRLVSKLGSIFLLTDEEKQALLSMPMQIIDLKKNKDVVRVGDQPNQCCLVLGGFACVYKISMEGKRQIMALHVPGDIPDLQSLHLKRLDINIASISPCTLGFIQHEELHRLCEHHPRLTAVLWRETLVQSSIFREWLLNIGQRSAYARIAHVICELMLRLKAVGLTKGNTFDMPVTQAELADATGITPVHVNRVLQTMRADGLVSTEKHQITVTDWYQLQEAGEFDPLYLHQDIETAP